MPFDRELLTRILQDAARREGAPLTRLREQGAIAKSLPDEMFVSNEVGVVVAVWRLIDHVNRALDLEPVALSTEQLAATTIRGRADLAALATLGEERLEEPLLVWSRGDLRAVVIDGNHRLERRHQLGLATTLAYMLPDALVRQVVEPWPP